MPLVESVDGRQLGARAFVALRAVSALCKVLLVTVGSICAVIFASLIITIIQFQLRLSEARTQNSSITLESVQLIADYQDNISNHYKQMRRQADLLNGLRTDYQSKLNSTTQLITNLCTALNPQSADQCAIRLENLINNNNSQVDSAIADLSPEGADRLKNVPFSTYVENLKQIITSGTLQEAQTKLFNTQNFVQSECQTLSQYISDRVGTSLLGVSPELRMTIVVQCVAGSIGDQAAAQTAALPVNAVTSTATPGDGGQSKQNSNDISGVNRILLSELVFYYKFYDWLTSLGGANLRQIILSPPEFIVIILVIATGILGSFLFHTYTMFLAKDAREFPSYFSIALRATLSVMCALVIYILSRTGFVAITEGQRGVETAISPFVIAFISVTAGLLAEKALERIQAVGSDALESRFSIRKDPQAANKQADRTGGGNV